MKRKTKIKIASFLLGAVIGLLLGIIHLECSAQTREDPLILEQIAIDRAYEAEVIQAHKEEPETEPDIEEEMYWDELELLAAVVEAEAGNQDLTGKRLVVDVVLNRVDSPLFPDTITEVIEQPGQFTTAVNGAIEDAGWNMKESDYKAVMLEVTGERLDSEILYFTAGGYNKCCTPAYIHGDHYFGYEKGGGSVE